MSFKKLLPILFVMLSFGAKANYMLVQNVTKLGNNPTNKTIQIQFDLSWQNSWRDSINWDAAWIFIKYKNANGLWQHARLNLAGYANGAGTTNTIKVASDSVGAFVYRDVLGSGNFNATSMQLQWNYGASGLSDVSALEVRVFATEMVYVPEGDFNVAKGFYIIPPSTSTWYPNVFNGRLFANGDNFPVINQRLTPTLTYNESLTSPSIITTNTTLRIKGDAGIDTNNDGIIDNTSYPTGFKAFYCYKYELTEQQYADFLNTLTPIQKTTLGVAGTNITVNNGDYFSSTPNKACGKDTSTRLLSYADWSGLRPMSLLEFNKASYGHIQPVYNTSYYYSSLYNMNSYPSWGSIGKPTTLPFIYTGFSYPQALLSDVGYNASPSSTRENSGASYYGIMDLTWNANEPVVKMNSYGFSNANGDGNLQSNGYSNISFLSADMIIFIEQVRLQSSQAKNQGFRYVRSAE
jgi:hypothetical protein